VVLVTSCVGTKTSRHKFWYEFCLPLDDGKKSIQVVDWTLLLCVS